MNKHLHDLTTVFSNSILERLNWKIEILFYVLHLILEIEKWTHVSEPHEKWQQWEAPASNLISESYRTRTVSHLSHMTLLPPSGSGRWKPPTGAAAAWGRVRGGSINRAASNTPALDPELPSLPICRSREASPVSYGPDVRSAALSRGTLRATRHQEHVGNNISFCSFWGSVSSTNAVPLKVSLPIVAHLTMCHGTLASGPGILQPPRLSGLLNVTPWKPDAPKSSQKS